jgi:cyclic pyranopterin monophosphate synthase
MTAEGESLPHLDERGAAHMVDVSDKDVTRREATAQAVLRTRTDVVDRLIAGDLPKGEALAVARVAAIQAAKQTSTLIPLCHPLPLSAVSVDLEPAGDAVRVSVTVRTTGRTGVEMEALTAATVGALTLYDMVKGVDRAARITDAEVLAKSGGRSGDWRR